MHPGQGPSRDRASVDIPGTGTRRRWVAGKRGPRASPSRRAAHPGAEFFGPDVARAQRDVRENGSETGDGCLRESKRLALRVDSGLEFHARVRVERIHLDGLDARRRLGRRHRLSGRRPAHEEHRAVYGVGRQCALVHLRCARSRANQADHRLQGRPHRGRGKSGGNAYRPAYRQRRGPRCGVAPLWCVAR